MKILLTDEEMQSAVMEARATISAYGSGSAEHWKSEYRGIAKAQLKKVVEWGNEFCDNHWEAQKRHKCSECWQALLKEVEGE